MDPRQYFYIIASKAQATLWKRGQKEGESQGSGSTAAEHLGVTGP